MQTNTEAFLGTSPALSTARSNTHEVSTKKFYQPETILALEKLVAWAHSTGQKIRPVGNACSPNGIGFDQAGMVNLALCDKVHSATCYLCASALHPLHSDSRGSSSILVSCECFRSFPPITL